MICHEDMTSQSDDISNLAELDPDRVRAALTLNRWGGRLAACVGALLPACILLVWSYFQHLRGGKPSGSPAGSVGVVLTMAYFAVLQYMIFVMGGTMLKMRFEVNRQLSDLKLELLRRTGNPDLQPSTKAIATDAPDGAAVSPSRATALADRLGRNGASDVAAANGQCSDRIALRGVTVKCARAGMLSRFLGHEPKVYRVHSISHGGMALACGSDFTRGDVLEVQILRADETPLDLVGEVKWQRTKDGKPSGAVGVAFAAFNGRKGSNTREAQNDLLKLLDRVKAQETAN